MDNLFQDWAPAEAEAETNEIFLPSDDDKRRACIESALNSDNPAVVDALSNLTILVRLDNETDYQERLAARCVLASIAASHVHRINRAEAHALVDSVMAGHHLQAMFALDHFVAVARHNRD